MADVTELRCWPSCVDAIDWSEDGIIALASDERVELLFPNTVNYGRDQETPQWQHVPLKVPLFSNEELPIKEPAPLATYSIGEEISNSAPVAIAWSPPGLAQHRRCALAALTANLVLSVWSAEGKPQEESSWKRRLIVNNTLAEHFINNTADESSHVASGFGEQMRLRTRIRAFAWAPALPTSDPPGTVGTRLTYGQHIVAVSNDDNQIAFVVIESPTSTLGVEQGWSAEVLTHCSLTPDSESIFSEPTFFDDMMKQQRHISHVAWSPWIIQGEWYHSVIVYATNEDVRARIVTYKHDNIGLGDEVIYPDIELRFNGPMTWSPRVEDGAKLKLALFMVSGLVYLTISVHDASIVEQDTHDLDGRWDQISGAVWDTAQHPTLRLHFSSLLSTLRTPTAALEASPEGFTSLGSPNWRDQIENNLGLFGVKNDLKGNSKAKVWGLATSPLGDFIVACNSVHPSDMIEYGPPAERRGTIAINTMRQYALIRQAFPARNVSAEGVLFTLRKLAANTVEDADQMLAFAEEMIEKLIQAYGPPQIFEDSNGISETHSDPSDIDSLIRDVRQATFLDPYALKDRYTILVSQACNIKSSNDLSRILIANRLATAIQGLLSSLPKTSFSAEILAHHQNFISLIHNLIDGDTVEASLLPEPDVEGPAIEPVLSSAVTANLSATDKQFVVSGTDICDICSAPIPFTDLSSAACTNGHRFPRCGISFLAIQAPGITKYCDICSTPFLGEQFVIAQEFKNNNRNSEKNDVQIRDLVENGQQVVISEQTQSNEADTDKVDEERDGNIATANGSEVPGQEKKQEQNNGAQVLEANGIGPKDADGGDERRELPVTLARVLFLACDVCIYCGGRFVG